MLDKGNKMLAEGNNRKELDKANLAKDNLGMDKLDRANLAKDKLAKDKLAASNKGKRHPTRSNAKNGGGGSSARAPSAMYSSRLHRLHREAS